MRKDLRQDGPAKEARALVYMAMAKWYERVRWVIPDDFLQRSHFDRVVRRLDWTSSPGYPYLLHRTTNGQFFGVKEGEVDPDRADAVFAMVQQRIKGATLIL